MGIFSRSNIPQSELRLKDIIPYYDTMMFNVQRIGKALYQGYLPNKYLSDDNFAYLQGYHDYKVYTPAHKEGASRRRKSMKLPKVSSEYLTKLIYTENVTMVVESSNESAQQNIQEFLDEVIEYNDYWTNSKFSCERMLNIGGEVETPIIKDGKVLVQYTDGTKFVAQQYDNSNIYGGQFISQFVKEGWYYTKLTKYTKQGDNYLVEKELYKSTNYDTVGVKVSYNTVFTDVDSFVIKNFKSIPFSYKKPRIANNITFSSPYGIPFWWNSLDIMCDVDLIFDRKHSEIKFGGRQKSIPQEMLKKKYDKGRVSSNFYNPDDETILGLDMDPESPNAKPTDLTSDIRMVFIDYLNQSLDMFSFNTGFSAGTFTSDGKTIQTATQVLTEKESTYQTKVNLEQVLKKSHSNLFMSIVELASAFNIDSRVSVIPSDLKFNVIFDDSVILDKQAELQAYVRDVDANRVEEWRLVAKQYNLSEEEAKEWVELARADANKQTQSFIDGFDGEE